MVRYLPATPGFGERLTEALGKSVGDVGSAYVQKNRQNRINEQDEQIVNSFNPEDPWTTQLAKFSRLSKDRQTSLTPVFNQFIKSQEKQGLASAKLSAEQQKEEQETAGLHDTLDFLDKNYESVGQSNIPGLKSWTAGGARRGTVQTREEIDRSGFLAADAIFTKYNKGSVSKEKLKLVQEMAPKSTDSERVYKAKVNALRRMAKFPKDISQEEFDKQLTREAKAIGKAAPKEAKTETTTVIAPDGTAREIPNEAVKDALANGGKLA